MTEHAGVYTEFVDALLEAGYGVYAQCIIKDMGKQ